MKPVVDAFADVKRHRAHGGNIFGQPLDQMPWGIGDLRYRVQVVVLQMLLVHGPQRHDLHLAAVGQRNGAAPCQDGIDVLLGQHIAHIVPGDGLEFP
jgi:hypothetical protein